MRNNCPTVPVQFQVLQTNPNYRKHVQTKNLRQQVLIRAQFSSEKTTKKTENSAVELQRTMKQN